MGATVSEDTKQIMVSVIVLTYNHERYIAQALESILNQKTDFAVEILVGDDVSTDGTREILRRYQVRFPEQIRLFERAENLGATRNAYELLYEARGEYLAFCEGDDYWTAEDKLARQVQFLQEHPTFIGCSHRCELVDELGRKKENQKLSWVKERKVFTLADFKGLYLPGQTATIVKRNIFRNSAEDYRFLYQANSGISDRTTTLLYLTKGPFGFLPETMSAYRQVENAGMTNRLYKNNPERLRHELEYTQKLEEIAATLTEQRDIFRDYYCQLYATAVYRWVRHPDGNGKQLIFETAKHIGRGPIHPAAFVRGLAQKLLARR